MKQSSLPQGLLRSSPRSEISTNYTSYHEGKYVECVIEKDSVTGSHKKTIQNACIGFDNFSMSIMSNGTMLNFSKDRFICHKKYDTRTGCVTNHKYHISYVACDIVWINTIYVKKKDFDYL